MFLFFVVTVLYFILSPYFPLVGGGRPKLEAGTNELELKKQWSESEILTQATTMGPEDESRGHYSK